MAALLRALVRGHLFDDPATLRTMRMAMPRVSSPFRAVPSMEGRTGVSGSWLFHSPELDVIVAGTVDQLTAGTVPFRFVPKLLTMLASELRPDAVG